jgi:hypothetical protein
MERVLLMCFSNVDDYRNQLQEIREIFRPEGGIFILGSEDENEIFLTFNTTYNFKMLGYIKVNKRKNENVLFTIDAINQLSIRENGVIDKNWSPNWEEYKNSLLIIRNGEVVRIPTKLKQIIKF